MFEVHIKYQLFNKIYLYFYFQIFYRRLRILTSGIDLVYGINLRKDCNDLRGT